MEPSRSLKDFTVIERLGEGSFACVYKVQRNDDKKLYAMKKVKISQMKEQQRNNALNEVRILASLSHPNIVNYKEAFFDESTQSLCIVMELATAGDIQKKINEHIKNHSYFTETQIWQALIQLARGLRALHEVNIFHRDLKCANVFCTLDNKYKLGDLNVSKVAKQGFARTQTGTPYYTSPEVWMNKSYNSKCDIWSLGCVIYEMASLHPPFKANNLKELCGKIQRGIYQRIPAHYSDQLFSLINACLKVNPNSRPSAQQILQNSKVTKNISVTEKFSMQNDNQKKCSLISTILCPRNLKGLKNYLPGAKYDNQSIEKPKSEDKKFSRVNSARSLGQQVQRVITTPKVDEAKNKEIKYAFMRRPPSRDILPMKKQPVSQLRQRQNSRQYSRNQKLSRNNSVDSMRKRVASQGSNRSIEIQKKNLENSREKGEKGKGFMEDISNRCKQIQERVRFLIDRKKDEKSRVQKVSESFEKKYNMPKISSRQKNDGSLNKRISRNNSVELRPNPSAVNNNRPQSNRGVNEKYKYLERNNKVIERNRSMERMERNDSRKRNPYCYGLPRK